MPNAIFEPYVPNSNETIEQKMKNLLNAYTETTQQLQWLLGHLDEKNVLKAKAVIADWVYAGNVTTDQLTAGTAKIGSALIEDLVVGGNVQIGSAEDAAGVTTIIGNTVTTGYVDALGITAESVYGGTVYVETDVHVGDNIYMNFSEAETGRAIYFGNTGVSIEGNTDYGLLGYGMVLTAPQVSVVGDVNLCVDNSGVAMYNSEEIATQDWVNENAIAKFG
jgi:hypothetical protein